LARRLGGGAWVVMALATIALWTIIVVAIVDVLRSRQGDEPDVGGRGADGAESILAARFARGEIDADEYRQRRDLLRSS
jgi:putative membrane protein